MIREVSGVGGDESGAGRDASAGPDAGDLASGAARCDRLSPGRAALSEPALTGAVAVAGGLPVEATCWADLQADDVRPIALNPMQNSHARASIEDGFEPGLSPYILEALVDFALVQAFAMTKFFDL